MDFSGCLEDPDTGFCCVEKEECVNGLEKDPILECTHKNVEQCHYTYVTQFTPTQEEVCEENFEKTCSITFRQQAFNETLQKCYTPVVKVCNGQGEKQCNTVYESSCTTRYIEKRPGKFVADTACEKLPTELCGAGCTYEEGEKECHEKVVTSLVDIPEEVCDLNPQKTCRYQTKLVPKLQPIHECTIIPKETCTLKFTQPRQVKKPLLTKWCLDPAEPQSAQDKSNTAQQPGYSGAGSAPRTYGVPAPATPAAPAAPAAGYSAPQSPEQYVAPSNVAEDSGAGSGYGDQYEEYGEYEEYEDYEEYPEYEEDSPDYSGGADSYSAPAAVPAYTPSQPPASYSAPATRTTAFRWAAVGSVG